MRETTDHQPLHEALRQAAQRHRRSARRFLIGTLVVGAGALTLTVWVFTTYEDPPRWFDWVGRIVLLSCLVPAVGGYLWWQARLQVALADRPGPVTPMHATGCRHRHWSWDSFAFFPFIHRDTDYLLVLDGKGLPRLAIEVAEKEARACAHGREVFVVGELTPKSLLVVSFDGEVVFPDGPAKLLPPTAEPIEALPTEM